MPDSCSVTLLAIQTLGQHSRLQKYLRLTASSSLKIARPALPKQPFLLVAYNDGHCHNYTSGVRNNPDTTHSCLCLSMQPTFKGLYHTNTPDHGLTLQLHYTLPHDLHIQAGAPASLVIIIQAAPGDTSLKLSLVWLDKTPTRLPESLWLRFKLQDGVAVNADSWRLHKLGQAISPHEVGDSAAELVRLCRHQVVDSVCRVAHPKHMFAWCLPKKSVALLCFWQLLDSDSLLGFHKLVEGVGRPALQFT